MCLFDCHSCCFISSFFHTFGKYYYLHLCDIKLWFVYKFFCFLFQENCKVKFVCIYIAGFILLSSVLGVLINHPETTLSMNVVLPKLSGESAFALMSLLGASIMPHNFYLHSSIVQVSVSHAFLLSVWVSVVHVYAFFRTMSFAHVPCTCRCLCYVCRWVSVRWIIIGSWCPHPLVKFLPLLDLDVSNLRISGTFQWEDGRVRLTCFWVLRWKRIILCVCKLL